MIIFDMLIFYNLPGVPVPHSLVPKLTTPTRNQGVSVFACLINGPPESPLQLSLPKKYIRFLKVIKFHLETLCYHNNLYSNTHHLPLQRIIDENFLNHNC